MPFEGDELLTHHLAALAGRGGLFAAEGLVSGGREDADSIGDGVSLCRLRSRFVGWRSGFDNIKTYMVSAVAKCSAHFTDKYKGNKMNRQVISQQNSSSFLPREFFCLWKVCC